MSTHLLLLFAVGCVHLPAAPHVRAAVPRHPGSVVIHDVRVFTGDAEQGLVLEHQDVRLEAGRITFLGPAGSAPSAESTVDGAGRTLLPGLVDLHVHLTLGASPPWFLTLPDPPQAAQALVYAGVTTVLDLGGELDGLRRLQAKVESGAFVGPRIRYAGPGLTVDGAYPLDMAREFYGALAYASLKDRAFVRVTGEADARAQVDRIADAGGTFVKLMAASIPPHDPPTPRISEAEMRAATEEAHARGLRVAAHIDSAEDARICARVGVDLLAHGVETSKLSAEDLAALAGSGIAVEPTLVNWRRFDELATGAFEPTRLEVATQPRRTLASFGPERLLAHRSVLEDSSFKAWADALEAHREDRIANVRAMVDAGIPLRVGSDSNGSIGTFPGALHEELRLLVEAGIPTLDVLTAATSGNAAFLDPDGGYGTIAPGQAADLLLVDGDPTVDIRHTEDIVQVWVGGVGVR